MPEHITEQLNNMRLKLARLRSHMEGKMQRLLSVREKFSSNPNRRAVVMPRIFGRVGKSAFERKNDDGTKVGGRKRDSFPFYLFLLCPQALRRRQTP